MTSHGGAFTWPASGPVEALDWSPVHICGRGLHGFLNGCGDGSLADWDEFAKWLVVEVDSETIVDLEGKVKFPKGEVVFCGTREEAIAKLEALAPETKHMPVVGATRVAGNNMECHAGYRGKAIAGNYGTATAGNKGKATAGNRGTAIAGFNGTAIAGNEGTATAGINGKATAGNGGTATADDWGTATAGNRGTATAGVNGTATAGVNGTATAGVNGTATAGDGGRIIISWYDEKIRMRTTIGYVGEDNIQANIPYQCDEEGKLVQVQKEVQKCQ